MTRASPTPDQVVADTRAAFLEVEQRLRSHDTSALSREQLAARARALDEFHRYAVAGVFPHNHETDEPKPIFVDRHGTLCAFANLLAFSGRLELVKRVAATRNDAKVADLVQEPEVVSWSRETGISIEEAATIQKANYERLPLEMDESGVVRVKQPAGRGHGAVDLAWDSSATVASSTSGTVALGR